MAYEMVMPYHLHMPSYFLETFTEYPHHKAASTKKDMSANEKIFEENNRNGVIKCPEGIDQYL